MTWETVIGLEIHAQLATRSKIFSGASTAYGAEPNTQACTIDLGLPGVLPVLNAEAVTMAVKFGLAVGARISPRSVFARKNYFYPDLPKGYQISQFELPIVSGGCVVIETGAGTSKQIGITRAHLEEDAGKSVHERFGGATGIDLNRAGTPLIEIVSEPDMRSAREATDYMRKVHSIVRYLGICDGNMQEGSFRCDANISVRRAGDRELGVRAEIKNLNSFRFVERAIEFEIERQVEIREGGGDVIQETRLYDPERDETRAMRGKEEANDYRYFPDPDLLPVEISAEFVARLRESLPELPDAKRARFEKQYGLRARDAMILTASRELADYFESAAAEAPGHLQLVVNWVIGELTAHLNRTETDISRIPVSPAGLASLVLRIADETLSGKMAKDVLESMWNEEGTVDEIIAARGLSQVSDESELEAIVDRIVGESPDQAAQFREGNQKVLGYFVGQVMKRTSGRANPKRVNEILRRKLS